MEQILQEHVDPEQYQQAMEAINARFRSKLDLYKYLENHLVSADPLYSELFYSFTTFPRRTTAPSTSSSSASQGIRICSTSETSTTPTRYQPGPSSRSR